MDALHNDGSDLKIKNEIVNCLNLKNPKSFFLFAGAGSGKTRTLVDVLIDIKQQQLRELKLAGKRVAVITYTVAATEEIKARLRYDSTFEVSTIHSFCWQLISPYTEDIRRWLAANLAEEILKLRDKQESGRKSKASEERARKIESKKIRLLALASFTQFVYSPTGANSGKDSLNHSEVISIAAHFLETKPMMQKIIVGRFPYLIIDESQDTQKALINALLALQRKYAEHFSLGLIGDMMQRIYSDGEHSLGRPVPRGWAQPKKLWNHRSPKRVVELINKIRQDDDGYCQKPAKEYDGTIRLFVIGQDQAMKKDQIEQKIVEKMASDTSDLKWLSVRDEVKTLVLEHHLAAVRDDFLDFFTPLYKVQKIKDRLLDGKLAGIVLFTDMVMPTIDASKNKDLFALAAVIKKHSLMLAPSSWRDAKTSDEPLEKARSAVKSLVDLFTNGQDPTLEQVLVNVSQSELFPIPDVLLIHTPQQKPEGQASGTTLEESLADLNLLGENFPDPEPEISDAWSESLRAPFGQIVRYHRYITGQSAFGTHQGVKGLEFERVMAILDDQDARGFNFSYEKLLGVKSLAGGELTKQQQGDETSIERSRRLLYVICSRAQKSLAVVAYTENPTTLQQSVIDKGWFTADEIIDFESLNRLEKPKFE